MRISPAPAYLYKSRRASVSPSWIRFRDTSYAVRTITRLSLQKSRGPHPSMHALVVVFSCLALYSAVQLFSGAIPPVIAALLFLASLLLVFFTASLTYFQPTQFKVSISMHDGASVYLNLVDEQEANRLHDAITRAMDWHRQPGIELDSVKKLKGRRALETTGLG